MANNPPPTLARKQLLIFLAVPVSILLIAVSFLVIPSTLARPSYDFIFSYCKTGWCSNSYQIGANERIVETQERDYSKELAQLYLYDVSADSYQPISLEDTYSLSRDASSVAPDGYRVEYDEGEYGGFLFGGSDSNGWQIRKGMFVKNLHLPDNYSSRIKFIAWKIPEVPR